MSSASFPRKPLGLVLALTSTRALWQSPKAASLQPEGPSPPPPRPVCCSPSFPVLCDDLPGYQSPELEARSDVGKEPEGDKGRVETSQ